MRPQKKANKITTSHKITMGALGLLTVVGGWNIIGRAEGAASASESVAEGVSSSLPTPTLVPASPTPWPTIQPLAKIPRLEFEPLPTVAAWGTNLSGANGSLQVEQGTGASFDLAAMPSAAPLPTLAPLPTIPEYVPPPPPPAPVQVASNPSSNGGGGGGNVSKGS